MVIDTNLFISGALIQRGNPFTLLEAWRSRRFDVVSSDAQYAELVDVLHRPKAKTAYGLTDDVIAGIVGQFRTEVQIVVPTMPSIIPLRDPDDELILMTAIDGRADYPITGDKDLLSIVDDPRLGTLQVSSAAGFVALLGLSDD